MDQDTATFDEWCIVELFGHQKIAGHVQEASFGSFLRVDVYDNETILYTRFLNPKAIYAINPVSKEVAIAVGKQFAQPPVSRWDMQQVLPQTATAPEKAGHGEDEWAEGF